VEVDATPPSHRCPGREDSRIDADTERQGEDGHAGEPGSAEQGARPVAQVLKQGFEQVCQIRFLDETLF
jgi:hypothetical protein